MSTVTAVDPHWLAELGGVFYSVKEKGYSLRDRRTTENEINKRMEIEAKMAEDKARAEEAERSMREKEVAEKSKEVEVGKKRPATAVVAQRRVGSVVRRPATPSMARRRGF